MPTIDRIAFTIFGLDIYWYAVIITIGMVLGVVIALLLAKRKGLNPDSVLDIILWTVPLAVVGARIYYVIFDWDASWTFARIFQIRDGGLAIYGGVIAGLITALVVCKVKKLTLKNVLTVLDCFVVALILGQAIGRWGNFVNQEAYGNLITNPQWQFFPVGVLVNGSWYQATFFYESMWNFICFGVLLFLMLRKKETKTGVTTCGYFIGYGIGRFFIEGLRSDSLYFLKNVLGEVIRVSQVVSLILILAGAIGLYLIFTNKKKPIAESVGASDSSNVSLEEKSEEKDIVDDSENISVQDENVDDNKEDK